MSNPRPANLFIIPLQDAWRNGLQPGRMGWKLHVTLERMAHGGVLGGATRAFFSVHDEEGVEIGRASSMVIEDYFSNINMWSASDPVKFVGFGALERGIPPTIIVPIAPNGAAFDYAELGRTFSPGPDGEIMEGGTSINVNGGMPRPISSIGPGRRLIAREPYITKLTNFLITFRQWYQAGGARLERRAVEEKRLGRAEKLVELRPNSGLRRGNATDYFDDLAARPILVEWFPDSGTDTIRITLPEAGIVVNDKRIDHVELMRVSAILADVSMSHWGGTDVTYVTSTTSGHPTVNLNREVKLSIIEAWNARRVGPGVGFPLRVTLEKTVDVGGGVPDQNYTAYATVTVERRFAGKYKGVPLLSVTINPANYSTGNAWAPGLFPERNVRTRQQPYTYGPYTVQQVMQGTSRTQPGRWELTRRKSGPGGYLEYTGWMVSVADVQNILVALDQRAEQGLSGNR